jgi:SAM-dependent methyltransferase
LERFYLLTLVKNLYPAYKYFVSVRVHHDNYRFRKQWPADALPLPPPRLIYLVTGQYKIQPFLANGALGSKCIRGILAKHGLDIEAFQSILDFGCGCGRIMRYWSKLPHGRLYGTDYNPSLIQWCRRTLPFARFSVNPFHGPFEYEKEQFDFAYAISVLTHLTVTEQQFWMNELLRVLRPGGYLYLTVHGMMRSKMTPREQKRFEAGYPVVFGERYAGSNVCATFCPESYMRKVLAKDFAVLDFIPIGAEDAGQDVYLLQKPHARLPLSSASRG